MTATITILPETDDKTLCLSLTGMITADDFSRFFDAPVIERCEKSGSYNLVAVYEEGFEGWTPEAADLSFKCISKYGPMAKKTAYVNAPDSRMLMMKMLQPIMKADVRYFDAGQAKEAIAWAKS